MKAASFIQNRKHTGHRNGVNVRKHKDSHPKLFLFEYVCIFKNSQARDLCTEGCLRIVSISTWRLRELELGGQLVYKCVNTHVENGADILGILPHELRFLISHVHRAEGRWYYLVDV